MQEFPCVDVQKGRRTMVSDGSVSDAGVLHGGAVGGCGVGFLMQGLRRYFLAVAMA